MRRFQTSGPGPRRRPGPPSHVSSRGEGGWWPCSRGRWRRGCPRCLGTTRRRWSCGGECPRDPSTGLERGSLQGAELSLEELTEPVHIGWLTQVSLERVDRPPSLVSMRFKCGEHFGAPCRGHHCGSTGGEEARHGASQSASDSRHQVDFAFRTHGILDPGIRRAFKEVASSFHTLSRVWTIARPSVFLPLYVSSITGSTGGSSFNRPIRSPVQSFLGTRNRLNCIEPICNLAVLSLPIRGTRGPSLVPVKSTPIIAVLSIPPDSRLFARRKHPPEYTFRYAEVEPAFFVFGDPHPDPSCFEKIVSR